MPYTAREMAERAVFTVLQRGSEIAVNETKYLLGVFKKLDSAKQQLESIQAFLTDLDDKMLRGGTMAKTLVFKVREVAQEMEDIIDTANILRRQTGPRTSIIGAISKYACFPMYFTHLHKIGARIDAATARMKTILEDFINHNIVCTAITEEERGWSLTTTDDAIQHWRSVHPDLSKQVDVIGFDYDIKQIKCDLLDGGNLHFSVFSIVGPAGAGKSTMANKVYGLAEVSGRFNARAWIIVSQRFVERDLLREMVKRTMGARLAEELDKMNQSEVKKMLRDFLRGRRYLIILDDVWKTDVWDMISDAFPADNKNGSRVILTTRNEAVANHPNARKKIYTPKLLNEKESAQLLLRAAIPEYILDGRSNNHNPLGLSFDDLQKVGKDLAKKCCGLPLALVVLGGHLSRNLDIAEWRKLTSSVDWHDLITTHRIGSILDLSYYDMPMHLRSCFMYTTAFPEYSYIDVRLLSNLWVAEGFIPLVKGHTREEIAFGYVNELVQRCMVQVEKRTPCGRILLIKVHDVLRDWGIGRARREGLIKDCHDAEDIEADYSEEKVKAYRMVLHGFLETKIGTSMRKLRTLLDFTLSCVNNRHVSKMLHHLRVLYLHGSGKDDVYLPKEIGRMRYLRYIGLGGSCCYRLPSSIGDLLNLETLDASGGKIYDIPGSLWKIPTLRHMHVSWVRRWSVPWISSQSKVHVTIFYTAYTYYRSEQVDIAKRVMEATRQQLSEKKKLNRSYCFGMTYVANGGDQIEIVGNSRSENQFRNVLASFGEMKNIRALKMCCTSLLSDEQKLQELVCMRWLQVLEIGEQSYTGQVITFPHISFPYLEQLTLHDLAVEEWRIEDGAMINLWELTLCKCSNLKCLPEGLSLLPRLKRVKLIVMPTGCPESTVARGLEKKDCQVFVSSDEKDFQHLVIPCS